MKNLTLETDKNLLGKQTIKTDNSTEFKDFLITEFDTKGEEKQSIDFMLDCSTEEKELRIGNIKINSLGLQLLKEFLNQ